MFCGLSLVRFPPGHRDVSNRCIQIVLEGFLSLCSKTIGNMTLAVFSWRKEHSKGARRVDFPRRDWWAFDVFALLINQ